MKLLLVTFTATMLFVYKILGNNVFPGIKFCHLPGMKKNPILKTYILFKASLFLQLISVLFLFIQCNYPRLQNSTTNQILTGSILSKSAVNEVHIKDFGAVGDGITNSTKAFQKAAAYLQQYGGILVIDSGTYILGGQTLSGSYDAGSSYVRQPIINVVNAKAPIEIKGYKAVLKAAKGLKIGSFNPVTGIKDNVRKKGNSTSYYASAFIFINAEGCSSISIKGLTMDGNSGNLDIGPMFDTLGVQLMATGIRVTNNKLVNIQDCYIHHCALDAIIVAWNGLTNNDPLYPHTITNVKATFNGRQGLSWVGGNSLTVTNCEFSATGKATNKGMQVIGLPAAGIDIEIENSIIKNGFFNNCLVYDNSGAGLSSIGHDTYNINFKKTTFIGTTNYAAFPRTQHLTFDSCIFVGAVWGVLGSDDKKKANSFKNCLFTMDSSKSPNGKVYGDYSSFYEAKNIVFEKCEFDAGKKRLPVFSNKEIVFKECRFYQNNNADFVASAVFQGKTEFFMKGKSKIIAAESEFDGEVFYNGKRVTNTKKTEIE